MNKTRIPVPGFALVLSALGPPGACPPSLLLLVVDGDSVVGIGGHVNAHSCTLLEVVSLTDISLLEVSKHTSLFLVLTPVHNCSAWHSWVLETTVILSAQTQINLIFRHVPFCFQQQSVIRGLFTFHHTNTRIIILSIIQRETKLGSVFLVDL